MRRIVSAASTGCRALLTIGLVLAGTALAAQPNDDSSPQELPSAADLPADFFDAMRYRFIGPLGNRVPAVSGVPGDPLTYYAGSASGGIFKSTDGGHGWTSISDGQVSASIGALAVSAADPNVVWAGTGEAFIRSNISMGDGVYRSTDAGKTWARLGLEATGRIPRIVLHPRDPEQALVASLGHAYGPQAERGVFRTKDGGKTWEHVLFVDEKTGCSDLVMDPNNPRILFAGMWQLAMSTLSRTSGGPGSGLWTSRDGGETWTELSAAGLPAKPWGKVALAMSADDSNRVYALIETSSNRDFAPVDEYAGTLWRSDDGGESWDMVNADNALHQRPLYYSRLAAMPDDADEVHFMATRQSLSLDGGRTTETRNSGWDHHDIWIDPLQPSRLITGHDGGVSISWNRGETWFKPQLPIAQMYHVATDRQIPYFVYGNRQDGAALRGPSNTLAGDTIPIGAWQSVAGCEVGFTLPDPRHGSDLYDSANGLSRRVSVWPEAAESWPGEDLKYRFHWTFPMAISPHDPDRVYVGSQFLHRTENGGQTWTKISPDLTSNAPELQKRTGGLTLDDAGPTLGPSLFAVAESPLVAGQIWTGSNDGRLHLSRDGGKTWKDLTDRLPDLPPLGVVSNIEPSPHNAKTVYLTVDRHQEADFKPYVYRSRNAGRSWERIVDGLSDTVLSYAHCVREDPSVPGLLYLGTESGLWVSFDAGDSWRSLQSNLPPAPVHWLTVQEDFQDLVIATYGRGFWILDDLSPIREAARGLKDGPLLIVPRPTYRFQPREPVMMQPDDPTAGKNPEHGAFLHYVLPSAVDELYLEIRDREGEIVRVLDDLSGEAGLHRVVWDLDFDPTTRPDLRTRPLENSHVRLSADGRRELRDGGPVVLTAPPGTYTVSLFLGASGESDGEAASQVELVLMRDPASSQTPDQLAAQYEVLFGLRDLAERAALLINELEWLRKQLVDLDHRLVNLEETWGETESAEVRNGIAALSLELEEVEGRFFDLRLTDAGQDTLRWKRLLWAKISQLASDVGAGDYPPTDSQISVYELLRSRLEEAETRAEEIFSQDLAAFRDSLRDLNFDGPITGWAPPPD